MDKLQNIASKTVRKKTINEDFHSTSLRKCLNTCDITFLGIGHMVGAGVYMLTGSVVRLKAGPSTILSYLFAGIAAFLSALCYAEFGSRIPKAGSAYSYIYITIGEIFAFLIGWNVVLEDILGVAVVARSWSASVDSLLNNAIRNGTIQEIGYIGKENSWIAAYPDFVAFFLAIITFAIVASGAKFSVFFNSVLTILNIFVILFITSVSFYFGDFNNWIGTDQGGFFPYGFSGTLAGAGSCFYAYVGFDGVTKAGEESVTPERSIPVATVTAMVTTTMLYVLITAALTFLVPYSSVDVAAPFPEASSTLGSAWIKYVVTAGVLIGITTGLVGFAFSLPRAVYSMANDGLLFKFLAQISPTTQIPLNAIAVFGTLSCFITLILETKMLIEFLSISVLVTFTTVAACVIILRYMPANKCKFFLKSETDVMENWSENDEATNESIESRTETISGYENFGRLKISVRNIPVLRNLAPGDAVIFSVIGMMVSMFLFIATLIYGFEPIKAGQWWIVIFIIIFGIMIVLSYLVIIAHEQNCAFVAFQMPCVPLIPVMSIFFNISLMLSLSYSTWIRLVIWMAVGLAVYFAYGMNHSLENSRISKYESLIEESPYKLNSETVQEEQTETDHYSNDCEDPSNEPPNEAQQLQVPKE